MVAAAAVTFEYVRERQERELWLVLMAHWISSWGGITQDVTSCCAGAVVREDSAYPSGLWDSGHIWCAAVSQGFGAA